MIELKQLSKSYGSLKVIDKIDLTIEKDTSIVLFGPSGCGKTTVLRLIAGLEVPDSGAVEINGIVASSSDYIMHPNSRNFGVVFQSPTLWPHMTIEKNLLFGMGNMDRKKAFDLISDVLESTGLAGLGKRYPHQLSGGQAKRAALARALVYKRDFYLMDEPISNQDDKLKEELLNFICEKVKQVHAGLIYITHNMDEAKFISDRIVKFRDSKLEA